MVSSRSSKPQWIARLTHALILCLACQPTCQAGSPSNRQRLRQRSQPSYTVKQQHKLEPPSQRSHRSSSSASSTPRSLLSKNNQKPQQPQTRIVNGQDARGSEDFPFFAQWYRGCGATLVHSDIILTAAHCYSDTFQQHKLRIEGNHEQLEVVHSRVHPDFNDDNNWINNNEYDFMVLKLAHPVPQIRPVPIHNPTLDLPLTDQEDLTIVGYGFTNEGGPIAKTMQRATVQYHQDCSFASYRPEKVGYDTMFCAHSPYNATHSVDTCQGDSGGPILRQTIGGGWVQVGVTSWGEGCARPESPGIYARTAVAFEWIQEQLCELSQVPPPHCQTVRNENGMLPAEGMQETTLSPNNNATASNIVVAPEHPVSSPQLDSTAQALRMDNTTTIVSTMTSLRVDVRYDNYPQEISWALAKDPKNKDAADSTTLVHVSRQQPVTVRNQWISQPILDIEAGAQYQLELYDTISGDGLAKLEEADAIQVWQLDMTVETSFEWDSTQNSTVAVNQNVLATQSRLLWSHAGDFGEFVRTTLTTTQQENV